MDRGAPSLARRLRARAARRPGLGVFLVQILLVGGAALAYFGVRGLTEGSLPEATGNAEALVRLERALGLGWEEWVQSLVIGSDALVTLANWVYIYGHWPVVGVALATLFVLAPDRYYLLRNAMFASGAIGLVIFALVPVVPPRLGILEIVDTVSERSTSYRTLQPPGLVNQYAALPSLHFGWNLLVGIVVWRSTRVGIVRVAAVAMVAAMGVAVVATANHYVVDVLAGGAVALVGLLVARELPRVRRTPDWARPTR